MKLYVGVLQMMFSLVPILRALKSVSSVISSHSQNFLSKAVGAALCLPFLLKPLVPTQAITHPVTL